MSVLSRIGLMAQGVYGAGDAGWPKPGGGAPEPFAPLAVSGARSAPATVRSSPAAQAMEKGEAGHSTGPGAKAASDPGEAKALAAPEPAREPAPPAVTATPVSAPAASPERDRTHWRMSPPPSYGDAARTSPPRFLAADLPSAMPPAAAPLPPQEPSAAPRAATEATASPLIERQEAGRLRDAEGETASSPLAHRVSAAQPSPIAAQPASIVAPAAMPNDRAAPRLSVSIGAIDIVVTPPPAPPAPAGRPQAGESFSVTTHLRRAGVRTL